MTIHVSKDTGCNLGCTYCYEEPDREINENDVSSQSLDVEAVLDRLEDWVGYTDEPPGLHGGEPLLIDTDDMRRIFEFVHEHWDQGSTHIQTNGTMLNDEHVELFREYNVLVGVSCDGPVELNRERKAIGASGEVATDRMSQRTNENLRRLAHEPGISVSVITVLHEGNAGDGEKLETLLGWMDELNRLGVGGHYNPAIPYEDVQTDISLSPARLKEVYLRTWEWMKEEPHRTWDPMRQYVDNLLGARLGNCVNNKCDVFNAGAAKIVNGQGETTGCGKTWSAVGDGVPFLQGDSAGEEYDDNDSRYEMLKLVPGPYTEGEPDLGGCKGCDYWNVCQGGCPSSGLDQDFRNRTRWCEAKYALYERVERDLRAVLPNIELITDLPWNADLSEYSSTWRLDIKPFSAMDPGEPGRSSSYGGYQHGHGPVEERVPEDALPELTWEQKKERARERYPEEHLEFDDEKRYWHADSAMEGWERVDDNA